MPASHTRLGRTARLGELRAIRTLCKRGGGEGAGPEGGADAGVEAHPGGGDARGLLRGALPNLRAQLREVLGRIRVSLAELAAPPLPPGEGSFRAGNDLLRRLGADLSRYAGLYSAYGAAGGLGGPGAPGGAPGAPPPADWEPPPFSQLLSRHDLALLVGRLGDRSQVPLGHVLSLLITLTADQGGYCLALLQQGLLQAAQAYFRLPVLRIYSAVSAKYFLVLGNVAGDSLECAELVVESGIIQTLAERQAAGVFSQATLGDLAWCVSCALSALSKEGPEDGFPGEAPPTKAPGRPHTSPLTRTARARALLFAPALGILLRAAAQLEEMPDPDTRFYISWAVCEFFGLVKALGGNGRAVGDYFPLVSAALTLLGSDTQCIMSGAVGLNALVEAYEGSVPLVLEAFPRFWRPLAAAMRVCLSGLQEPGPGALSAPPAQPEVPPTEALAARAVGDAAEPWEPPEDPPVPAETLLGMLVGLVANVYAASPAEVDPALCGALLRVTECAHLGLAEAAADAVGAMLSCVSRGDVLTIASAGAAGAFSLLLARLSQGAFPGGAAAGGRLGALLDKTLEILRILAGHVFLLDRQFARAEAGTMRRCLEAYLLVAGAGEEAAGAPPGPPGGVRGAGAPGAPETPATADAADASGPGGARPSRAAVAEAILLELAQAEGDADPL